MGWLRNGGVGGSPGSVESEVGTFKLEELNGKHRVLMPGSCSCDILAEQY